MISFSILSKRIQHVQIGRHGIFVLKNSPLQRWNIRPFCSTPKSGGLFKYTPFQGIAIGTTMGCFGSIVGVGGGILGVPLLMDWAKLSQRQAIATSILTLASANIITATLYYQGGAVDIVGALVLAITASIGARIGALGSQKISDRTIRKFFALYLLIGAPLLLIRLYFGEEMENFMKNLLNSKEIDNIAIEEKNNSPNWQSRWSLPFLSILGSVTGLLAGVFGIGGGLLMTPILSISSSTIPQHIAIGTSLMAMIPPSTIAAYTHHKLGNVKLGFVPYLLFGSVLGSMLGVRVSFGLTDEQLKWVFSIVLFSIGIKTIRM